MTGQVDGQERSVQGQSHGVPRVGVLPATVEEDQLRRRIAPHQCTDPAPGCHLQCFPAHGGRGVERQPDFLGVLVEE